MPHAPDLSHLAGVLLVGAVVVAGPHHSRHAHHSPGEAVIAQVTTSVNYHAFVYYTVYYKFMTLLAAAVCKEIRPEPLCRGWRGPRLC